MFERFNPTLARTDVPDHRSRLTTQNGYAGGRQEATDDPVIADNRNFYKVELWDTRDRIERMPFAGTSLDRARFIFADYVKHRPVARLTIRRRSRVRAVAEG